MFKLRDAVGLVVAFLLAVLLSSLLSQVAMFGSTTGIVVQPAITAFIATMAGAMIARRSFVLPALLAWLLYWAAIIYILYLIAAPTGQASVQGIVAFNGLSILLSGAAAILGALAGQSLQSWRSRARLGTG